MKNLKNLILLTIFICTSLILGASARSPKTYLITDFGAVNDTMVVSTSAIQMALDKCIKSGGGRVVVPKGDFVTGTIWLGTNVELHLEKGAQLLGSTDLHDYSTNNRGAIEAPYFNKCLVYAQDGTNIKITGEGTINGRGSKEIFPINLAKRIYGERPMLLRFDGCENILIEGVTFINSASWCTHLVNCDDIIIRNLTINSHVNRNNDGIDLDGCRKVLIEDCNIISGDDGICPKSTERACEDIVVKNCKVASNTSAFKCGTSSRGGFKNITVSDCDFSNTRMGAIKLQLVDGGIMENINISNITMTNVEGPIFIRLSNRGRLYDKPTEQIQKRDAKAEGAPMGKMRNITISNLKAEVVTDKKDRSGIMISGIPEHKIENVILKDIEISYPGGGTEQESEREVPELLSTYPEQFFFGVLPSWGAYIRHASGVSFENVKMSTREKDMRERIITIDVDNFIEK